MSVYGFLLCISGWHFVCLAINHLSSFSVAAK